MSSRTGDLTDPVVAATPGAAAETAAEALRLVNHLTLAAPSCGTPGWSDAGDVYRLLGELRIVADRLPQVCDQIVSGLQQLGERSGWLADEGTTEHPDEVVSTAVEALKTASWIAEDVSLNLQHAHGAVSHLYQ